MHYPTKVEITENGIKIHNVNALTTIAWMVQRIEFLPASTYTLTVKLRKSRADLALRVRTSGAENTTEWQTVTAKFTTTADRSDYQLQIATTDSDSGALADDWVEIAWVKLELGKVATPFVAPDPATELVKCQRFFRTISRGAYIEATMHTNSDVIIRCPFETPMRTIPTVQILNHKAVLTYSNGWIDESTELTYISANITEYGVCYIHISGFNLTVNDELLPVRFPLTFATDNIIGLDAEIY